MALPDLNVHKSKMEVLLGVTTHACHHNSWKAQAGGLQVSSRPWLRCKTMPQEKKKKIKQIKEK